MSTWSGMYSEEEQQMVAQVGGRARGLVQAIRRNLRERGEQGGPFRIYKKPQI